MMSAARASRWERKRKEFRNSKHLITAAAPESVKTRMNLVLHTHLEEKDGVLLEPVCTLWEGFLGMMGGGPEEEDEFMEEDGGPGDTESRRSPPIWFKSWLFGLWGRRGLICTESRTYT